MKTARWLAVSLAGNVALGIVITALILRRPPAAPAIEEPAADVSPAASPASEPQPVAQTFRWSQLAATQYSGYIANLRASGCPEQTISDIVTAEVDRLYAPKRHELEAQAQLAAANEREFRPRTLKTLADEREKLLAAETSEIADLLGLKLKQNNADETNAGASDVNLRPAGVSGNISLPLVFAGDNPNSLNLSPAQMAILSGLRQRFITELGGTNADPNSHEYAMRWQNAQPTIDQSLKTMLGYQVYRQLERQGGRRMAAAQPANP